MRFTHSLLLVAALSATPALAEQPAPDAKAPDTKAIVDDAIVASLREIIAHEIVRVSVDAQNQRLAAINDADITRLDESWKSEREADDQPLIAATLSSPLSVYLTRIQARSLGLYPEIFVMDRHGLNVGQSAITSDFWQGDEDKFQKSFSVGRDAVFIDEAEWDDEFKVWRAQVSLTIAGADGQPIGAATFELNLTELERRQAVGS